MIGDLASPDAWEYAAGVNRQFGSRAAFRADFVYRDYGNFYADYTSPATSPATTRDGPTTS